MLHPYNSRVRFVKEPFSGKLCCLVKAHIEGTGTRWDTWLFTSDLEYFRKKSCYRPRVHRLVSV